MRADNQRKPLGFQGVAAPEYLWVSKRVVIFAINKRYSILRLKISQHLQSGDCVSLIKLD